MNEFKSAILKVSKDLSKQRITDLLSVLKSARNQGIKFGINDVRWLYQREYDYDRFCPEFIAHFIIDILKNAAPKSILNVNSQIGEIISPLCKVLSLNRALAVEDENDLYEIAQMIGNGDKIEWKLGKKEKFLGRLKKSFDIVIQGPNWESFRTMKDNEKIRFRLINAPNLDEGSARLLDPKGIGFLISGLNIDYHTSSLNFLERKDSGLFFDSIFYLPKETFSGYFGEAILIILKKEKPVNLFVGELSPNSSQNIKLLRNYLNRIQGKTPNKGFILKTEDHVEAFKKILDFSIERHAKQLRLKPTSLFDLVIEYNLPKDVDSFDDKPNSIYFPETISLPVESTIPQGIIKRIYLQLVLDPDEVLSDYLVRFYNSEIGKKMRARLYLSLDDINIESFSVYIPDIKTQIQTFQTENLISELSSSLQESKKKLWEQPSDVKSILKKISEMKKEERFEDWLDTLPFPLASILWTYHAAHDEKDKVAHLLNFFEALSQYNITLMISAYSTNLEFYKIHCKKWLDKDPQYKEWYRAANFGSWNMVGKRISKATRGFLGDKNNKMNCKRMLGFPSEDFINMITDKRMYFKLDDVLKYRNNWKGHGGIVSHGESKKRLEILKIYLTQIRSIISRNFLSVMLLKPESSNYRDGVYYYKAKLLRGRSYPFKEVSVQSLIPMDVNKLYILHEKQSEPVELLPLIQLAGSPETEQNAFYFYSRIEENQAHFVSYHFENKPELDKPLSDFKDVFKLLEINGKFSKENHT